MDLYFYMQDVRADIDRALADYSPEYFVTRICDLPNSEYQFFHCEAIPDNYPRVNLDKLWDTLFYNPNVTGLPSGSYFNDPIKAATYLQAHGLSDLKHPEQDSTISRICGNTCPKNPETIDVLIRCYLVERAIGLMAEPYLDYTIDYYRSGPSKRFQKLQATIKTLI